MRLSTRYVEQLCASGDIPAERFRRRGRWRIPRSFLAAYASRLEEVEALSRQRA